MNVSFARNDPLNSDVVDSATGRVLFEVSTPWRLGTSTTTLRDEQRDVIAQYERRWGHDRVTYHGETRRLSDWLPKKGFLSSSRLFTAPSGRMYLWKKRSKSFQLLDLDSQSKRPVAESHSASHGIFSRRRPMGITMGPELIPFLDAVVLSFIICEKERRESESVTDGGDGGGLGGDGG